MCGTRITKVVMIFVMTQIRVSGLYLAFNFRFNDLLRLSLMPWPLDQVCKKTI